MQKVKVLPSGRYQFVKNTSSNSKKSTKKVKKSQSKRRRSILPRRKKRRSARKFTLPIAPIAGLAAGLIGPAQYAMAGNYTFAVDQLAYNYTGIAGIAEGTPHFNPEGLTRGLLPLVIGGLVHKFVGGAPLNLNRMLASAGVPVIRI